MSSEQQSNTPAGIASDRLRSIVDRYERLDEDIRALRSDQKDLMAEAKSAGFDVKALRVLIRNRRQDAAEREELELLVATYERALGQLSGTPLADAAVARETTRRAAH